MNIDYLYLKTNAWLFELIRAWNFLHNRLKEFFLQPSINDVGGRQEWRNWRNKKKKWNGCANSGCGWSLLRFDNNALSPIIDTPDIEEVEWVIDLIISVFSF